MKPNLWRIVLVRESEKSKWGGWEWSLTKIYC